MIFSITECSTMDHSTPSTTRGDNTVHAALSPFFQNKRQDSAGTFLQIHTLFRGRLTKVDLEEAELVSLFKKESHSYSIVLYDFVYNLQSCFYLCFQICMFLKLCFRHFCVLMSSICSCVIKQSDPIPAQIAQIAG